MKRGSNVLVGVHGGISSNLISTIYRTIRLPHLKGGPAWMDSDRFDVEAKTDHAYNLDDLHTMY
ncbi:DUF3738 domain-containing protein [Granulicella sp. WH15]|nr:DUF3738 domain-containing protein [Granulicella sp. WH15]